MDPRSTLDREFSLLSSSVASPDDPHLLRHIAIAQGYAEIENALVVLSDLSRRESHIFAGGFAAALPLSAKCAGRIPSIWEQEIINIIHPHDAEEKILNELMFFHHVRRLPKTRRFNFCLHQHMRMRTRGGGIINVLHRLFYIPAPDGATPRFALCLYSPVHNFHAAASCMVDNVHGTTTDLSPADADSILSHRELAVVALIDQGLSSKDIATRLSISVNTVSRHRQNINAKLQVHSSIEACRRAQALGLIR